MTYDAAIAWVRSHETNSYQEVANDLLRLLAEETAELKTHYLMRLADEEKRIMDREYGGDPAPFAPGGPRD